MLGSLGLSHIDLAVFTGARIAGATAATGRAMIISAEGSDRTDTVLVVHRGRSERFGNVEVTVRARLRRTPRTWPVRSGHRAGSAWSRGRSWNPGPSCTPAATRR